MRPQISVVIPAYNESRLIESCLRSLHQQDFTGPFEIIVVDNNSTDETGQIAKALGATVVFEPTRGVCSARQAGTLAAQGEIIISTDADTQFSTSWLSHIWSAFQGQPEVVAVAGTCQYIRAPLWASLYARALFGVTNARYLLTGEVAYITAANTAFRKSAWTGYNTKRTQGEDEFGLLAQLKPRGKIIFQRQNIVYTSSRRLQKGLWYNLFVTILLYYCVDYFIGKFSGRSILGSYATVRQEQSPATWYSLAVQSVAMITVMLIIFGLATHRVSATQVVRLTSTGISTLGHSVSHFRP